MHLTFLSMAHYTEIHKGKKKEFPRMFTFGFYYFILFHFFFSVFYFSLIFGIPFGIFLFSLPAPSLNLCSFRYFFSLHISISPSLSCHCVYLPSTKKETKFVVAQMRLFCIGESHNINTHTHSVYRTCTCQSTCEVYNKIDVMNNRCRFSLPQRTSIAFCTIKQEVEKNKISK